MQPECDDGSDGHVSEILVAGLVANLRENNEETERQSEGGNSDTHVEHALVSILQNLVVGPRALLGSVYLCSAICRASVARRRWRRGSCGCRPDIVAGLGTDADQIRFDGLYRM